MTHLYLIRHGEAWGAVHRRILDVGENCGLTDRGRAQAARLRDRLAATGEIQADVLIASTFPRARETAEIIAPALGLPLTLDDEVQELRAGEAEGMSWEEFDRQYGGPEGRHPFQATPPGGENWAQFNVRVGAALHRITTEHAGKTIVVVCHGGVVDVSFLQFLGISPMIRYRFEFYTYNTSITHWQAVERRGEARWRLRRYNDGLHLHDSVRWVPTPPTDDAMEPSSVPLPTEPLPGEES
jgi:probable phosphoglycerate mutase